MEEEGTRVRILSNKDLGPYHMLNSNNKAEQLWTVSQEEEEEWGVTMPPIGHHLMQNSSGMTTHDKMIKTAMGRLPIMQKEQNHLEH